MEALTKAVWGFMEGSYRKGVLDDLLGLMGALSDPNADLSELLGNFEDRLRDANFSRFEETASEILTPLLETLAEEKVQESLHVLLTTARPLLDGVLERAGGDTKAMKETLNLINHNLVCLKTVALALMPVLTRVHGPSVETFVKERAGALAADIVNRACAAINRNPEIAARTISDFFTALDGRALGTAAETVVGAVLDQRPPIIGWTASTLVKRGRKRLSDSTGERRWGRSKMWQRSWARGG